MRLVGGWSKKKGGSGRSQVLVLLCLSNLIFRLIYMKIIITASYNLYIDLNNPTKTTSDKSTHTNLVISGVIERRKGLMFAIILLSFLVGLYTVVILLVVIEE